MDRLAACHGENVARHAESVVFEVFTAPFAGPLSPSGALAAEMSACRSLSGEASVVERHT